MPSDNEYPSGTEVMDTTMKLKHLQERATNTKLNPKLLQSFQKIVCYILDLNWLSVALLSRSAMKIIWILCVQSHCKNTQQEYGMVQDLVLHYMDKQVQKKHVSCYKLKTTHLYIFHMSSK